MQQNISANSMLVATLIFRCNNILDINIDIFLINTRILLRTLESVDNHALQTLCNVHRAIATNAKSNWLYDLSALEEIVLYKITKLYCKVYISLQK